ncbi:bifunctional 3-(3-hydroxy-phenyl)propionate/3-hydroxycinnamic acid hydroxylase [Alphaproteobacteria bacterium]|nr:bifunctional 3-(3-hydroxy-phenyl)propionate/3-hydroxycinnamic acid hydroxylase [Alphaproteobacteria bacterium]
MSDDSFDVVIVGLGPVGGVLANMMGKAGINTLVIEREAAAYPLPRAVHFDDQTMRVFQSIGVAEKVEEVARINPGMRFVDKQDNLLLDWPRPQEVGPFGWHPSYRFHQPDIEKIMNDGLDRYDCVKVMRNTNVHSLKEAEDSVTLIGKKKGQDFKATGRYVVGCDGAKSIIRQHIGSEMIDFGFQERWLVVDVVLTKPRPDLGDFTIQTCNPERPSTYVRCPLDRRRWEINLLDHEDDELAVSDDFVWARLAPKLTSDDAVLERKAVYRFESKLADIWRRDRMMIAGDAAHLMPPFMGQGMCTGVRDASNLGWKLISVLRDGYSDDLLDSYGSERAAHAETYINTTMNVGTLMNSCETAESLISAMNPDDGTATMASILRGLGPGLANDDDPNGGTMFAQPTLLNGVRLDDYGDGRFIVLARGDIDVGGRNAAVINPDHEPSVATALATIGIEAAIIRPDGYVLCGYANAPSQGEINAALALS